MKTYYITNQIAVDRELAEEIGNNGEVGDACQVLMIAPQVGKESALLYLTTNGDPWFVGWLDECGDFVADDKAERLISSETWLAELLGNRFGWANCE